MDATIERHGSRRNSGSAAMRTFLAAVGTLLAVDCSTGSDEAGQAPRVVPIAALGRMLFFDRALSADGQVSCATCHQPERA